MLYCCAVGDCYGSPRLDEDREFAVLALYRLLFVLASLLAVIKIAGTCDLDFFDFIGMVACQRRKQDRVVVRTVPICTLSTSMVARADQLSAEECSA